MKTIKRQTLFIVIVMVMIIATLTACGGGETLSGRYNAEVAGMDFGEITGGLEFFLEFDGRNVTLNVPGFSGTVRYTIDGDTITLRDNDLAQAGWNMRINADRTRITMGGIPGFETVFILEGHETPVAAPADSPALAVDPAAPPTPAHESAPELEPEPEPEPEPEQDDPVLDLPLRIVNTTAIAESIGGLFIDDSGNVLDISSFTREREGVILGDVRSIAGSGGVRGPTFFIRNDNSLWARGNNRQGQLGDGTGVDRDEPVQILDNVANVYSDGNRVYAITMDGVLYRWGAFSPVIHEPEEIANDVVDVLIRTRNSDYDHVLRADGSLWKLDEILERIAGNILYIRTGGVLHEHESVHIGFGISMPISVITQYFYAIRGDNSFWQILGDGRSGNTGHGFNDVKDFAMFGETFYVIRTDDSLWGWGNNSNGQLGDGTRIDRDEPVHILDNVAEILASSQVLDNNGNVWTWDRNDPTPAITFESIVARFGDNLLGVNGVLYRVNWDGLDPVVENVMLPSVVAFDGETMTVISRQWETEPDEDDEDIENEADEDDETETEADDTEPSDAGPAVLDLRELGITDELLAEMVLSGEIPDSVRDLLLDEFRRLLLEG